MNSSGANNKFFLGHLGQDSQNAGAKSKMTNSHSRIIDEHLSVTSYYHALPKGQGIRSATTITLSCTIRNSSDVPLVGKFHVTKNTWTLRSIDKPFKVPPGSKVDIGFELHVQPGPKTIEDVPETFGYRFVFTEPGSYEISKSFINATFSHLAMGMLYDSVPDPPKGCNIVNIVFFGLAGTGKSSSINSFFTLFGKGDDVVTSRVKVGGLDDHSTTDIRRHLLPAPMDKVALWDVYGLAGDNYLNGEARLLCKGFVPDGFHMNDKMNADLIRKAKSTAEGRRPAAILVFLSEGQIADVAYMDALKVQLGLFGDVGMNPIVIVSMVDKTFPELLNNAMAAPPKLNDILRLVADTLKVPPNRTTYCVSYNSQKKRNFFIDQHNYMLLEMALRAAGEYIASETYDQMNKAPRDKYQFHEDAMSTDTFDTKPRFQTSQKNANPQEGDERGICAICLDNPANVLLFPCKHACICSDCMNTVKTCPIDRSKITNKEVFFTN